ncbi:cobyrinate a,c-diamide synthase [Oscillospiraceae bacterium PP1C4]
MHKNLPRLMIAAAASGSGKTTVICAVLRALINRGLRIASFKCGPDYIDPMFHRESVGTAYSSNLDLFFSDENTVRYLIAKNAEKTDMAITEGVMGYYDGIAGISTDASSYALACATETPVVLVVNCRGMSVSIAAQVKGFIELRSDSHIAAVILNNMPPSLYQDIKALVERECGVPVAGYLPPMADCSLESRHLGLVTAAEVENLQEKLTKLAQQVERTIELDRLILLASSAPPLDYEPPVLPKLNPLVSPRIAVARDAAFCFYYADSLTLLRELGAELVDFSPMHDSTLPDRIDGLLLGGGYPELYTKQLSDNKSMCSSIKTAIESGLPTIAECGGFLYLHRTMQDVSGTAYPMVDVIAAEGYKTEKLGRFGYVTLTAHKNNMLCSVGESMPAHEFHYWDSTCGGEAFLAQKPQRITNWSCVHASHTLYAGFPHLYLAGCPQVAARFLHAAIAYRKEQTL